MPSPLVERAINDSVEHNNAILKFISPNDAGITGSHQYGYLLPKNCWQIFTTIPPQKGKTAWKDVRILWQDGRITESRIRWYGAKTRSEYRLTRFGKDFPYRTENNVGDLLVLIRINPDNFRAYVFDLPDDIEDVQAGLGVEIKETIGVYSSLTPPPETENDCIDRRFRRFVAALTAFPNSSEFSNITLDTILNCVSGFQGSSPDDQLQILMSREYDLFCAAERLLCQKEVCRTYRSVNDFLSTAMRVMNRRKSRAGRSLENHVEYLLKDAKIPFDAQKRVDGGSVPDILIPSRDAYNNPTWPTQKLFMVGIKRTCKDRWRQVLHEAPRIHRRYILTVQPGVSANQLIEMRNAGISLIVPRKLHPLYPEVPNMKLLSVGDFIQVVQKSLGLRDQ